MRIVVTGGAGFIGSHYVRSLCAAPTAAHGRAAGRAGHAHLRGQPRQPATVDAADAASSSTATSATPTRSRDAARRRRRGRALRGRVARRPVDRGRGGLRAAPTSSAPRCCWTALAHGRRQVRARLHRRGLRLDRRAARGTEDAPARAQLAVLGVARRARTCSPAPTTARTACPCCITRCSNNYGPYQFPEKVIPLFVDEPARRPQGAALRRRAERARLAARRRPLPRHPARGREGARRGGLQHRRRHRADQPRPHRPAARRGSARARR